VFFSGFYSVFFIINEGMSVNVKALRSFVSLVVSGVMMVSVTQAGFAIAGADSGDVVFSGNQLTPMPKFLNKAQAIVLQQQTGNKVRIAYNIDHGQAKSLNDVPETDYFYFNPYSQIISAAVASQDAIDLAQVIPQVFFVIKGDSLSTALHLWAAEAGYQLQWDYDYDYNIQYSYSFHGNLTAKDGPLNQILESFKRGDHAIEASVMGNQVIVIKENTYKPAAVIGY
jgi:hypothetical protein